MQNIPDNLYILKNKIDEAEQSSEIIEVLGTLDPLLAENSTSRECYAVLIDAFHTLRVMTSERVEHGESIILLHLLDYLEKDSEGTTTQKNATRQLRECLEEWMAQYSEYESIVLRQHILKDLVSRFHARPSRALCWTFAYIGYREKSAAKQLWDYALHHDDETTEAALVALTSLGVTSSEHALLLNMVHQKLYKHTTQPLLVALERLSDPTSFNVLSETCFSPSYSDKKRKDNLEIWLALNVLTQIADAHDNDEELQDKVWMLIADLYNSDPQSMIHPLNLGSGIAPHCDSKQVVPTLLSWLGQASDEEKQKQFMPTLSYRLEECVRPRQIMSWQQTPISAAIPILYRASCQNTQFAGRSRTHEMYIKEASWGTILRMGYAEALSWFTEAISKETNLYLRGELCDLFACFSLEPVPNEVIDTIHERYDAQLPGDSGEIIARLGAVKVAQSAASQQAFEALLECGLTVDKQPLLASVEALSEIAHVLIKKDKVAPVIRQLLEIITSHPRHECRLAAARALETLAEKQSIPSPLLQPLVDVLLTQPNRDPFECSIILSTLASQQDLFTVLIPQVKKWAQERDDQLAFQSFSFLARYGLLHTDKMLLNRLGISSDGSEISEMPGLNRTDWRAHIIGQLYLEHPETFLPLIVSMIKTYSWSSLVYLLGKLTTITRNQILPPELAVALIERVRLRQTRAGTELDLIRMTAELVPEALALESWNKFWLNWLPDARTALADALGTLHELSDAAHTQRVALLQMLMSDGHYGVRRAAYRGLQQCAPYLLQQWCWTWSQSNERSLRWRAAEGCAWFLSEGEEQKTYINLFQILSADPEPEVRRAALRTRQERRKRLWAQEYLARLMQATQGSTTSNETVLALWPCAEALKRVGDDTTIRTIHTALGNSELPPHIRHWYQLILKDTSEGWAKAIKKWPQPANMWMGSIEVGHGTLLTILGKTLPVQYTMWRDDPQSLVDKASWGGTIHPAESLGNIILEEQLFLRMEDGRQGEILLMEKNESGGISWFVGQGAFPQ